MSILSEQTGTPGRPIRGGHYAREFIGEVVNAISEGLAYKAASISYGVPEPTLSMWMSKYGSVDYQQRKKQPISPQLKRTVVRAVDQGLLTIREARIAYNIKGNGTIRRWQREQKQENAELVSAMKEKLPDNKVVTSNTPADIQALQQALADAQLKIAALNTLIDVAEEQLKINIRKKPGAKQ
jgi:transposase-like protein